ncbi:hypothetical protein ONE63_000088 [Megalurothrips usitatus]|uniref:Transposable element P transposase n=1 Tax=Megalurothrips usitatus TaxID=439358 RepID=A0AAV7Y0U5_9NEOP|nr:hypothetical protein ONE63_000088 [Megalurothrips usitatus]
MKKAPPDVIKIAKTAQQYKQMAFNIKKKLLIAQRKEGNFQRIASTGFITRVDEMLVSRGAKIILHGELKNFKRKHQKMKSSDLNCILLFDEVFLVSNLSFNKLTGKLDGFEDYGRHGRTSLVADHALVFMAQGITKKWTQPVAYYFVHGTCPSHMLKILICDVVRALHDAGYNVLATASDQGPTNQKAVAELKSSTKDEIFYEIDGRRMVHIWDIPHILKNVRNNLLSSDIQYKDGLVAEWRHLIEFFKLDESLCKLSPLTYKHMEIDGKLKMKVKYAAQLFSAKTGNGIENNYIMSDGKYLKDCMVTADFCRIVDEFFDLSNGPSSSEKTHQKKPARCAVTKTSIHHSQAKGWPRIVREIKNWVMIRKTTGERHIPPCVKGWVQSIKSMQWLWLKLNDLKIFRLNLRHLNQDAIENLFSSIRQCCGAGSDLTTIQFTGALKTCLLTHFTGKVQGKNCEDDDGYMLNDMRSLVIENKHCYDKKQSTTSTLIRGCQPLPENIEENLHKVTQNAPTFICGSILNDILLKWNCSHCLLRLTTSAKNFSFCLSSSHYSMKTHIKHYPSPLLVTTFTTVFQLFEDNWIKMLHKDDVLDKVVQFFEESVSFSSVTCLRHAEDFKTQFLLKTALYLLDRKCKRINSSNKKGVFRRTRQVTYSCKNVDGLRKEDENHQLADSDLSLLDGSQKFLRPQKG